MPEIFVPSWQLAIALLPLVGFLIGVRFQASRGRRFDRAPEPDERLESREAREDRTLQLLDTIRAELSELAERQNYAERLLAKRLPPAEAHTPV